MKIYYSIFHGFLYALYSPSSIKSSEVKPLIPRALLAVYLPRLSSEKIVQIVQIIAIIIKAVLSDIRKTWYVVVSVIIKTSILVNFLGTR